MEPDRQKTPYPDAARLLITADSGGANGNRRRTWKTELAALAAETGLAISVCHLPPGTSKWNKIEHRLFAQITMNWRGRPLESHKTILNLIGATTTTTGLAVTAQLDNGDYPTGIKITDREMQNLPLARDPGTASGTTPCTPHATHPNRTDLIQYEPIKASTPRSTVSPARLLDPGSDGRPVHHPLG